MKPQTRFLVLLLIIALVPLPLTPTATATTTYEFVEGYSSIVDPDTVGSPGSTNAGIGDGQGGVFVAPFMVPDTSVGGYVRCEVTTTLSCFNGFLIDDASGNPHQRVKAMGGTRMLYCGSGTSGILVGVSENNFQGLGTTLARSTAAQNCDITGSGNTIWIIGGNATDGAPQVSKSTNGGSTWTDLYVTAMTMESGGDLGLAASDANNVVFVGQDSTGVAKRCYSTDGGTVWTCLTSPVNCTRNVSLKWSALMNRFEGSCMVADAFVMFHFSTVSSLMETKTLGVPGTDNIPSFYRHNTTTIVATFATANARSFYITTDNGLNWDGQNIFTGTGEPPYASAVGVSTTGSKFGVVYVYDDDTAPNDLTIKGYIADNSVPAPTVGTSATASVTGLVGFEVDPSGTRALARVDAGKNVKIWSATTLGTADATVNTNCDLGSYNHNDMIFAKHGGELVAFINCADENNPVGSGGPGDPQFLSIRVPNGGPPTIDDFDGCTPSESDTSENNCPYNIDLSQFDEPADSKEVQLGQIQEFPISYTNGGGGNSVGSFHRVAWGFSSTDGQVGVAVFNKQFAINGEQHLTRSRSYAATLAEDFCTGEDNGEYYLGAVDSATQSKVFPLTWTNFATSGNLDVSVNSGVTLAAGSNAIGIACGGGQVAVTTSTAAYLMPRDGNSPIKTITGITGANHGVMISEEFEPGTTTRCYALSATCRQWWGFVDGSTVRIYDSYTGTQTCSLTIPGGTVKEIVMQNKAQKAWIATTTTVGFYDLQGNACSTAAPVGQQPLPTSTTGPVATSGAPTGNFFGIGDNPGSVFGAQLGVGEFGGNLLLASSMILSMTFICAAGLGAMAKYRSVVLICIGAGVGVLAGFLFAWGFGFLNNTGVFVICVLIVLGLVIGAVFLTKGGG